MLTRQRLTWDSLTPRSQLQTGDLVSVWDHEDDQEFRGIYIGFRECMGEIHAEIADEHDPDVGWFWEPDDRVTIKLLRESIPILFSEDDEPIPLSPRERTWIPLCILGGCLFWGCLFLWAFWR